MYSYMRHLEKTYEVTLVSARPPVITLHDQLNNTYNRIDLSDFLKSQSLALDSYTLEIGNNGITFMTSASSDINIALDAIGISYKSAGGQLTRYYFELKVILDHQNDALKQCMPSFPR